MEKVYDFITKHNCSVNTFLALLAFVYITASIFYMIATIWVGTPFKDSLTPLQIEIKKQSASTRGTIFSIGLVLGIVLFFLLRPFQNCN